VIGMFDSSKKLLKTYMTLYGLIFRDKEKLTT